MHYALQYGIFIIGADIPVTRSLGKFSNFVGIKNCKIFPGCESYHILNRNVIISPHAYKFQQDINMYIVFSVYGMYHVMIIRLTFSGNADLHPENGFVRYSSFQAVDAI